MCANGHEVAIEVADCFTVNGVWLLPDATLAGPTIGSDERAAPLADRPAPDRFEREVLETVRRTLSGADHLADAGVRVADVGLAGAGADISVVVIWSDPRRSARNYTGSWKIYDRCDGDGTGGADAQAIAAGVVMDILG